MDEFDYENYGMEYGEYNTPESKDPSSDESSVDTENIEDTLTVAAADSSDVRRIVKLDLGNHDFPAGLAGHSLVGPILAQALGQDHGREAGQ